MLHGGGGCLACANRNKKEDINMKFEKPFLSKKVIPNLEDSDMNAFVEVAFSLPLRLPIVLTEAMVRPQWQTLILNYDDDKYQTAVIVPSKTRQEGEQCGTAAQHEGVMHLDSLFKTAIGVPSTLVSEPQSQHI